MVLYSAVYLLLVATGGVVVAAASSSSSSVDKTVSQEETPNGQHFTGLYRRIDWPTAQDYQQFTANIGPLPQTSSVVRSPDELLSTDPDNQLPPDFLQRYHDTASPAQETDYMTDMDSLAAYTDPSEALFSSVKRGSLSSLGSKNSGLLGRTLSSASLGSRPRGLFSSSNRNALKQASSSSSSEDQQEGGRPPSYSGHTPLRTFTSTNLGSLLGRGRGLGGVSGVTGARGRSLSLSIDASMQVLRQALLFRSALKKQQEQLSRARQNQQILNSIGKRSVPATHDRK